jgi:phosphoglycerol transferase MdoB-like AlkP superfamily enzyme
MTKDPDPKGPTTAAEAASAGARLLGRMAVLLLVFLAAMTVFRWVFYLGFADRLAAAQYRTFLPRAFLTGARFDLMVLAYLQIPCTLAALLGVAVRRPGFFRALRTGAVVYYTAAFGALSAIEGLDQAFYSYFQDHFNLMVFGLFDDDTGALLRSIWQNYPVVLVFALGTVYVAGVFLLGRRILRRGREGGPPASRSRGLRAAAAITAALALHALAARGSLGIKPLGLIDTDVSPHLFVNQLTLNGPYALKQAIRLRWRESRRRDLVSDLGYRGDEPRAFSDYLGRKLPLDRPDAWRDALTSRTPRNPRLEAHPPHVVLVVMESFGSFLIRYQSSSFDILGAMAGHLDDGILFPHFLPGDNGTIGSLSCLVANVPARPGTPYFVDSRDLGVAFATGAGLPFREAGYDTTFVYGGRTSWRYLDRFVGAQGFDHVEGSREIRAAVAPGARGIETYWGVYDEYLFRYLSAKLASATRPQFIVALTTTNHPPYDVPPDAATVALAVPEEIRKRRVGNPDLMMARFRSYRYACDHLGRWLSEVEAAPWGASTIVAVTGDHNVGGLVTFSERELLDWRGVPLFLHIPPGYLPDPPIDRTVFGSHSDVMPTLYHLALSGRPYVAVGADLLDASRPHVAMNASGLALSAEGGVLSDASGTRGFRWSEAARDRLEPAPMDGRIEAIERFHRAAEVVAEYVIRAHEMAGAGKPHPPPP